MAEFNPEAMDRAAEQARQELEKDRAATDADLSLADVIAWWSKWYLEAGHKRLGRILVKLNKKRS